MGQVASSPPIPVRKPYDPLLYVCPDKVKLARRLFGSRDTVAVKFRESHPTFLCSTVHKWAARLDCTPQHLIDVAYYEEKYGAPLWAIKLVAYDRGLDKWSCERLCRAFKRMMGRFDRLGLDRQMFWRLVAGWSEREDWSKRCMTLAKWLCQDGGGAYAHGVLKAMMDNRMDIPTMADRVKEAVLKAYADAKKED